MYKNYETIRAFDVIPWSGFIMDRSNTIKKEIESKGKEYILGEDEEEYKNYLFEKYYLEPLEIDDKTENVNVFPSKERVEDNRWGRQYEIDVYNFTVKYKFKGTGILFSVRPDNWILLSHEIHGSESDSTIAFDFKLYNRDPEEFKSEKQKRYEAAFTNIANINKNVESWNNSLRNLVSSSFDSLKAKYLEENKFFEAINVKVNKDTEFIFTTSTIKKQIIPQPTVSSKKELSSIPTISKEIYDDVLKVIYVSEKNMEKKPTLYQNKDEEGLRDMFLFLLETRYEGTTATGETFNRNGKTDILLKYAEDGSNLFVAECKFWHGAVELHKAISQLLDRYLTWRDSKVSLILFITNKEFTKVIETIKSETVKHPYFVEEVGARGETSFSYQFHLPQDKNKKVYLEVMEFHYDK